MKTLALISPKLWRRLQELGDKPLSELRARLQGEKPDDLKTSKTNVPFASVVNVQGKRMMLLTVPQFLVFELVRSKAAIKKRSLSHTEFVVQELTARQNRLMIAGQFCQQSNCFFDAESLRRRRRDHGLFNF